MSKEKQEVSTIEIKIESIKLRALQKYLSTKNKNMDAEMQEYIDKLYKKYVPAEVRSFIEDETRKE